MSEDLMKKLADLTAGRPELAELAREALGAIASVQTLTELEEERVRLVGKKGSITAVFKGLGALPPEEKPVVGEIGNLLRRLVEQELASKSERLSAQETEARLLSGAVDVTLPGRRMPRGHKHLLIQVKEEVTDIFVSLGYRVAEGPEVELDYYNFEALNTPAYHPARSLQDTFYVRRKDPVHDNRDDILLRTHTSPVQIRVMEKERPPLYVISPGTAYRKDEVDATHSPVFNQVEGFAVGPNITMGDLKGTLEVFAHKLFGADREVRFRPHFFPFTEPSAEVDVSCYACEGAGCGLCKGVGWLEILGCGMIDPAVFSYVGYDPEEFSGFAFGGGIERIAMMKYNVDDMRVFFENDARFLRQF
ncbi:MAG TPA: phenylalanine--tRNA ligase subunit alpha [Candidatus Anoxymicrobiaceae bacterium]|jgi:phenylalanyl-tRNA synthetase alpha chain